jgi:hypothetical protein
MYALCLAWWNLSLQAPQSNPRLPALEIAFPLNAGFHTLK